MPSKTLRVLNIYSCRWSAQSSTQPLMKSGSHVRLLLEHMRDNVKPKAHVNEPASFVVLPGLIASNTAPFPPCKRNPGAWSGLESE